MTDFELDARPYFQILHNLIRQDELDYDPEQTAKSVEWVRANSTILHKVCTQAEFRVITTFYTYWDKHKIAPDRQMMHDLIHSNQQPKTLLDVMEQYDHHVNDLEQVSHLNLDMYLDQRKLDYEKYKLSKMLSVASLITVGSVPMNDKAKTVYTGPRDAMKYIHESFQKGIMIDDVRAEVGGDTAEVGGSALALRISKAAAQRGNVILTQTPIDDCLRIGPEQPIRFAAVMASTGHGKSAWLFGQAYHAALARYRVLFVPRECSVDDAWMRFYWLHAETMGIADQLPPLPEALEWGVARQEHVEVIRRIEEDMIATGFRIDVRQLGDWPSIKAYAQAVEYNDPYDVLVIDYVAHLVVTGRVERDEYKAIYRGCQQLSQDYAGGRGLVVLTALQTNKQGQDEAAAPDAAMDKGIYTSVGAIQEHTFAAHDLDLLIGLWSGEEYKDTGLTRISCVKARGKHFRPFFMERSEHNLGLRPISGRRAEALLLGEKEPLKDEPRSLSPEIASLEDYA